MPRCAGLGVPVGDDVMARSYTRTMAVHQNDSTPVSPWIERVWKAGGTDLFLTAGSPPLARIDGLYSPLEGEAVLTGEDVDSLAVRMLTPDILETFRSGLQADFSLTWQEDVRIR